MPDRMVLELRAVLRATGGSTLIDHLTSETIRMHSPAVTFEASRVDGRREVVISVTGTGSAPLQMTVPYHEAATLASWLVGLTDDTDSRA